MSSSRLSDDEIITSLARLEKKQLKRYLSELKQPLSREVIFAKNIYGGFNLLQLAIPEKGAIEELIKWITKEDLAEAMAEKYGQNSTFGQMLCMQGSKPYNAYLPTAFLTVLNNLSKDAVNHLLIIKFDWLNALGSSILGATDKSVCELLKKADNDVVNKAALQTDEDGKNVFHHLIKENRSDCVVDALIDKLTPETIFYLMNTRDKQGKTPFGYSIINEARQLNKSGTFLGYDPKRSSNSSSVRLMKYIDPSDLCESLTSNEQREIYLFNPALNNMILTDRVKKNQANSLQLCTHEEITQLVAYGSLTFDNTRYMASFLSAMPTNNQLDTVPLSNWSIINRVKNWAMRKEVTSSMAKAYKENQNELSLLLNAHHILRQYLLDDLNHIILCYLASMPFMLDMMMSEINGRTELPFLVKSHNILSPYLKPITDETVNTETKISVSGKKVTPQAENKSAKNNVIDPTNIVLSYLSSPYVFLKAKREIQEQGFSQVIQYVKPRK